ncbi:MAG TPA: PQQ-dependent sugar dehydrogenase [Caldimonas sp.]|jgi:glucose/arabinose dehydrogenase|nr:PQQ-dependent sugar dehydrogenase [Caldimonas sp.]HEX2541303.1 PQQ-dependent sugar dehydrogenase [Caldimonas sp.]
MRLQQTLTGGVLAAAAAFAPALHAQTPELLDARLTVRTVVSGLAQPTSIAFLGGNDFLVLEKATGRVQRVVNGVVQGTVLDLAVNSASERGLLGIALDPQSSTGVYLYWTESSTGADSTALDQVPLLGNRVDRYVWNGTSLTFDRNIIRLRALQADPNQPLRGNHNGGVLRFGPDGKLYVYVGDVGRRGWMQNLPCGPTAACPGPTVPDDQFGGPAPDDAHLTGVILRLNPDGSAPADNPFFAVGGSLGGEVGANLQKVFVYGVRNGFGMQFDPQSGRLWAQENGDDSFTKLDRYEPGQNSGWIQIRGPVDRIAQYKDIEVNQFNLNLQQLRWPPTLIADTPAEAVARLFSLPGSQYKDPQLSWKYEVAPAGLGFAPAALGPDFAGDLFMGSALDPGLAGGFLFRIKLTPDRLNLSFSDPRLADRVVDNVTKTEITESESLLIGRNFGTATAIEPSPRGTLYVVSLSKGSVFEIAAARLVCDADANGRVDRNDIAGILSARGTAAAADDPRDADRDGTITVLDARACTLQCTAAQCAP